MAEYLIVLVVAALVTWFLTPLVRRMAIRLGADYLRVVARKRG